MLTSYYSFIVSQDVYRKNNDSILPFQGLRNTGEALLKLLRLFNSTNINNDRAILNETTISDNNGRRIYL